MLIHALRKKKMDRPIHEELAEVLRAHREKRLDTIRPTLLEWTPEAQEPPQEVQESP